MKIDLTILQIALIFFPGILWASIHERFSSKQKSSNFHFVLNAFLFGIVSYVVTASLYTLAGVQHPVIEFMSTNDKTVIPTRLFSFLDLLAVTIVAIALAIAWTYSETYKLAARLLQAVRATRKYGDEDVWDFTFNSSRPDVEYVQVRDFEKSLVYSGWVDTFSVTGQIRELLLREVQIHDFAGKMLYEMPHVYIARKADDIHIDLPYRNPVRGAGGN